MTAAGQAFISSTPGPAASRAEVRAWLLAEYARPFVGWDFTSLTGRRLTIRPSDTWDYEATVSTAARTSVRMLDMDTGGGERLAALPCRAPRTTATEGYAPNVHLAGQRLTPLGVALVAAQGDRSLPFSANTFDLIANRHGAYLPPEVVRVLNRGGQFITQQVGWKTNLDLYDVLGAPWPPGWNDTERWELATAVRALDTAGLVVIDQQEEVLITRYFDAGAVVFYLKALPWAVPDFTVDRYLDPLVALHRHISDQGPLDVRFHQFFIHALRT